MEEEDKNLITEYAKRRVKRRFFRWLFLSGTGITIILSFVVGLFLIAAIGSYDDSGSGDFGDTGIFNGEYTEDLPIFKDVKGRGPITDEMAQYAVGTAIKYRLLPSVILSQFGWESAYGTSPSARNDTNFFGITWFSGCPFPQGSARGVGGSEGGFYMKFPNAKACFSYYGYMVATQSNFNQCVGNTDPGSCLLILGRGGYAAAGITESSAYYQGAMGIIKSFNLTEYDEFAIKNWGKGGSSQPSIGGSRAQFVELVTKQAGKPYVWGGKGPDSFDCSGLIYWALKQLGINFGGSSSAQWGMVEKIKETDLKPGDLIFYGANAGRHVSIYIEPGKCFEAKSPSEGIGYGNYKTASDIVGFGRIKELNDGSGGSTNGDKNFICPITSPQVTSEYGYRTSPLGGGSELHNAIDLVNGDPNTPIMAAMSGTVVEASGKYFGWYGNYVVIQHSNGKYSGYAHLSSIQVSVGQKVKQGQQIGNMGTTGPSTGPHLHFQIGVYSGGGGGMWENPRNYVKF